MQDSMEWPQQMSKNACYLLFFNKITTELFNFQVDSRKQTETLDLIFEKFTLYWKFLCGIVQWIRSECAVCQVVFDICILNGQLECMRVHLRVYVCELVLISISASADFQRRILSGVHNVNFTSPMRMYAFPLDKHSQYFIGWWNFETIWSPIK